MCFRRLRRFRHNSNKRLALGLREIEGIPEEFFTAVSGEKEDTVFRLRRWRPWLCSPSILSCLAAVMPTAYPARAADEPFLVTYSHQMEELGNLEIETKNVTGRPTGGDRFLGSAVEFEYSVTGRWTTSVYFDGQATDDQSTFFTGYRWENRFRLLKHNHWINPVLYAEYANLDAADKTLVEVVGRDSKNDLIQPDQNARREKAREVETRLILGSSFKGWTLAENLIAEKNLRHAPFEFGYTVGVSRPLSLAPCNLCGKNFQVGLELYGGLGTADDFNFRGTSHYIAPVASWTLTSGTTFRVSPGVGVTRASASFLLRIGVSYGFDDFGRAVRNVFSSHAPEPERP